MKTSKKSVLLLTLVCSLSKKFVMKEGGCPNLEKYGLEEVSGVFKKYLRELPEPIITDGTPENELQFVVKQLVESMSFFFNEPDSRW